jgi:hypothetical protein
MRAVRVQKGKCYSNPDENIIDYSIKFRPLYPTVLINTDMREVNSTLSAIVSTATYSCHLKPTVNVQNADQCVVDD